MNVITKAVSISKSGLLDEYATLIEIDDLGGGEFVRITQPCATGGEGVGIEAFEWPAIHTQIDNMIADIEKRNSDTKATLGINHHD